MTKVVISHSEEDKNIALDLANKLQKENLEIWIAYTRIKPGHNFIYEIVKALKGCDTLILLWSKSAAKSFFVRYEWTSVFASGKCIIPCIIDNENLPPILNSIHFIDFVDFECGYNYLVESFKNTTNNPMEN